MGEKRKSDYSVFLKVHGKESKKIELFDSDRFRDGPAVNEDKPTISGKPDKMYRLRINGKWYPEGRRQFLYRRDVLGIISNYIEF